MKYNFEEIEQKWQAYWSENGTFKAENDTTLPKYYVLDMFPYPSGAGLHVGHPLGYIASDIVARYKRHKGFNVLHPQGYDSFGLPAEQYAVQTGQHPAKTTEENIQTYRRQLDKIGFSFDWSREFRTSDPSYYKWTQSIFIDLFNHYYCKNEDKALPISQLAQIFEKEGNVNVNAYCDEDTDLFTEAEWQKYSQEEKEQILSKYRLTYLSDSEVNWCEELGTVLANDEVVDGVSERGGYPVTKKKMRQWSMRIGAYAERLLNGLEKIDWSDSLKEIQRNWIGKSEGVEVHFQVKNAEEPICVFTTRPDTIFGATFLILAPELDTVLDITSEAQRQEVENYIQKTKAKSDIERQADTNKTGVFTGAYAVHPLTKEQIPIWISDYVLANYGTGAVMAVPCGDQRDYEFAKKFDLPIKNIFKNADISEKAFVDKGNTVIAHSQFLNDLSYKDAYKIVLEKLESIGAGRKKINYRLRDAVFSRQRYWGEPIPIYYKNNTPTPLPKECLPVALPEMEDYKPKNGKPPLANASDWAWDEQNKKVVSCKLIDNKTVFPIELDTMPGWAGSSWYFNRYMDATNEKEFVGEEAVNYWREVDLYIGGVEHATGHLLYSRFWQKFLYDIAKVPVDEYAKKLINQGMILGESAFITKLNEEKYISANTEEGVKIRVDIKYVNASNELDINKLKEENTYFKKANFECDANGKFYVEREVEKMSKSKLNVLNPDDICEQYGADTLRMYEMFLGPLEQSKPWSTAGITGVHSFLKKFWKLFYNGDTFSVNDAEPSSEMLKTLHKTIKKVTFDIENFSFNTCVSTFMICINELTALKCNHRAILEPLVVLIEPFAPHFSEELWNKLGHSVSVSKISFPIFEEKYLVESTKKYPISFNGKMRFTLELPLDLPVQEIEKKVLELEETKKILQDKTPKKVIVVPQKIINIVF